MSRYTVTDAKGRQFTYGFDRPLSYYFLTYDRTAGGKYVYRHLVGMLSPVYGSACNLLQELTRRKLPIPEEHRAAMLCDLPF